MLLCTFVAYDMNKVKKTCDAAHTAADRSVRDEVNYREVLHQKIECGPLL